MKFLPKPTSFAITNPPFSPGNIDKRSENTQAKIRAHTNCKNNISRPVKLVPIEARRKTKSTRFEEPTSPKVSCMGQIKEKKPCKSKRTSSPPHQLKKVPFFTIGSILRRKVRPRRPSEMEIDTVNLPVPVAAAPSLGQLKRFTCRRENTLAGFNWKANLAAVNPVDGGVFYMNEGSGDKDVIMVPHSEPKLLGGGATVEPKGVNLWKRRIMEPPRALQLD